MVEPTAIESTPLVVKETVHDFAPMPQEPPYEPRHAPHQETRMCRLWGGCEILMLVVMIVGASLGIYFGYTGQTAYENAKAHFYCDNCVVYNCTIQVVISDGSLAWSMSYYYTLASPMLCTAAYQQYFYTGAQPKCPNGTVPCCYLDNTLCNSLSTTTNDSLSTMYKIYYIVGAVIFFWVLVYPVLKLVVHRCMKN